MADEKLFDAGSLFGDFKSEMNEARQELIKELKETGKNIVNDVKEQKKEISKQLKNQKPIDIGKIEAVAEFVINSDNADAAIKEYATDVKKKAEKISKNNKIKVGFNISPYISTGKNNNEKYFLDQVKKYYEKLEFEEDGKISQKDFNKSSNQKFVGYYTRAKADNLSFGKQEDEYKKMYDAMLQGESQFKALVQETTVEYERRLQEIENINKNLEEQIKSTETLHKEEEKSKPKKQTSTATAIEDQHKLQEELQKTQQEAKETVEELKSQANQTPLLIPVDSGDQEQTEQLDKIKTKLQDVRVEADKTADAVTQVTQPPVTTPTPESKVGEEAKKEAQEVEFANEQMEDSNEEVVQSEKELAQTAVESREKVGRAAKEHANNIEKEAKRIVEANDKVNESESKTHITDNKEISNTNELATASEKAADAKLEVKNANEQVQNSVDGSKSKLELETELMERLAAAAKEAAEAKQEFVEANKVVSDSVDGTKKKAGKKDKYAANKKVSEEDFNATYYSSIANESLKSKGYTILGGSVNAELIDGLVKVSAKVKDAEGSWKSFTSRIDGDGNLLSQRFNTVTQQVNKLDEALENLENEGKPSLTYQEIEDQVNRIRNELNLSKEKYSVNIDDKGFVTIAKIIEKTSNEVGNLKQQFKDVEEAIENFGNKNSNVAEKTVVSYKAVNKAIKSVSDNTKISKFGKDGFDKLANELIKADVKLVELQTTLKKNKELYGVAFDTKPIEKSIASIEEHKKELEDQLEVYKKQAEYLDRANQLKLKREEAQKNKQTELDMAEAEKIAHLMLKGDKIGTFPTFEDAKKGALEYAETIGKVSKEFQYIEDVNGSKIRTITTEVQTATGEIKRLVFSWKDGTTDMTVSTKMLRTELKGLPGLFQEIGHKVKQLAIYWFANAFNPMDLLRYGRTWFTFANQYDDALTEMMKVSNETIGVLQDFQKESFKLADAVGTTAQQLQSSTADFLRLGESLEEAKQSAQDANILFNVSEFGSITEATDSLISMSQAYKELEKSEINDILNFAGNNFSLSTSDLATALKDAAAVLKTQGNDIYESVALITAGNAITQDPLKTAGGVRTISLRIAGTEEAKEELESLGESVDDFVVQTKSKTQETIKNYTAVASNMGKGIDVLDANGNLRNTYDILLDISRIYKEIQKEDKKYSTNRANALVEYLAGKNRSNIASSILLNSDLLEEVKNRTMSESENSAQEELDRYLESISGHVAKLQNQWQNLWAETANRDIINFFLDMATSILKAADEIGVLNVLLFGGGGIFTAIKSIQGKGKQGFKNRPCFVNMPLVVWPLMDT